ncbi:protein YABBY 2-like [Zingiber officinale]|uniref:YABBY2 n=1 Tax=Zingiber officinale TaxID=94328 RepID=A0A8J5H4K0_ZINOF|nr:protein YABBY 2-like [Zingiber officinale]XP_042468157.1 protein YABBY 2-like [Zingiber officinale]XP_042473465.1 protein YABBY 2-like [Zingiber officinale]KAG6520235.1 hypothetical protein ZIOFF_017273 [Zingiber officinale]
MSSLSSQHAFAPEQVCYVNCNFCNTVLVVNVPSDNSLNVATVRCGLCANLLSVNLQVQLEKLPLHKLQNREMGGAPNIYDGDCESSSRCSSLSALSPMDYVHHQMQLIQPATEKRRVPSAYNRFIKEEIRRLKAKDPNISHKEAFSTAAKNWAHFPEIRFGLSIRGNEQV